MKKVVSLTWVFKAKVVRYRGYPLETNKSLAGWNVPIFFWKYIHLQSGYVGLPECHSVNQKTAVQNELDSFLVGGFNPSPKNMSQIGSFPQVAVKMTNRLKSPPSFLLVDFRRW